jgi:hypothetical protein
MEHFSYPYCALLLVGQLFTFVIHVQVVTVLGSPAICPHHIVGWLVRRLQGCGADS